MHESKDYVKSQCVNVNLSPTIGKVIKVLSNLINLVWSPVGILANTQIHWLNLQASFARFRALVWYSSQLTTQGTQSNILSYICIVTNTVFSSNRGYSLKKLQNFVSMEPLQCSGHKCKAMFRTCSSI